MKLPGKSANQANIDIADYYAVKPGSIWRGLKQESAAFWWLCIYMIFEYVRPQSIYTVIDVLPWAQIALLLACITAYADRNIKLVRNPANFLFVSFFIIVLLSSVFAFLPSKSFEEIHIPVNWLILYFLIISIVDSEKKFIMFMLLFFLVNFKMSQHGFFSYAQRGFGYAKWGLTGSPGWFENAGDFGIQMTIFAPLATAFILALRSNWGRFKRLLFYLLPFTGLISIVGTSSRGAQLGIAVVGVWFLLKSRRGIKAIAGIVIVGWALYSILPQQMLTEYSLAGEDKTSEHRLVMWEYGLEVVGDNPVLGVGLENWVDYCWFMNPNGIDGKRCLEAHNTYIEALTEIGITGFVVFLLNMSFIFILNARTRANAKQLGNKFISYIAHGLDGGLVGCMAASMFFSVLFYPMFWLQLAMTVSLYEISRKQLNNSVEPLPEHQA